MPDGKEDEYQAHKHSQMLVETYGSRLGKWLRYSVCVVRPDSKFQKLRGLGTLLDSGKDPFSEASSVGALFRQLSGKQSIVHRPGIGSLLPIHNTS